MFNLSVEEDESYVADGCAVHNCQDYSVAKTLNQARGLQGKKGVLWWQIHRLLEMKRPPFLFLENVDRLLKSPASQRGRDFAIMLATLNDLGYEVEWRVVNAADYGFPQKRRRVYIVGRRTRRAHRATPNEVLYRGIIGRALPVAAGTAFDATPTFTIDGDPAEHLRVLRRSIGADTVPERGLLRRIGGSGPRTWSRPGTGHGRRSATSSRTRRTSPTRIASRPTQLAAWRYLKGAKREPREHKGSGTPYLYVEGAVPIPGPDRRPVADDPDRGGRLDPVALQARRRDARTATGA